LLPTNFLNEILKGFSMTNHISPVPRKSSVETEKNQVEAASPVKQPAAAPDKKAAAASPKNS
jgi:hypothetical protein